MPAARERSRSRDPLADEAAGIALLERFDNFAAFRNGITRVARLRDQWAGIPMPIDGMPLTIEPRYYKAAELEKIGVKEREPAQPDDHPITIRNVFHSRRHGTIWVYEDEGRVRHLKVGSNRRLNMEVMTLGASVAWGIEQEGRAVQLLGTLLRHHAFKQYLLTGMFLETSKRSGLTYLFRKLRPTVVLDARDKQANSTRVLCCLCMHPIGFYNDTWAGAMTPTDDVISHLMLMRGDEPMLWRRSNQHAPYEPEAGL